MDTRRRPNIRFLSTLPARGATHNTLREILTVLKISIHAPREGSDQVYEVEEVCNHYISIHAPREGSDLTGTINTLSGKVISIHAPREGSDATTIEGSVNSMISIHAPREGSDFHWPGASG